MSRKCTKCGTPVIDSSLILCPSCGHGLPTSTVGLQELTHEQEVKISEMVAERIENSSKFKWKIIRGLALWVLAGIGLITLFVGGSIWEAIRAANDNIKLVIQKNIESQFKDPHIKETVSEVAANQASNMMLLQIKPQIEQFGVNTSNTVAKFNEAFIAFEANSTNAINNLMDIANFNILVERANADDFQAVKKLKEYADNYQSRFFIPASATVRLLVQKAYDGTVVIPYEAINWDELGLNPTKATMQDMIFQYIQMPPCTTKVMLMRHIACENRFPKQDRINWLFGEVQSGLSTEMTVSALRLIADESKLKASNPFDVQNQIDWWNANKKNYTNAVPITH